MTDDNSSETTIGIDWIGGDNTGEGTPKERILEAQKQISSTKLIYSDISTLIRMADNKEIKAIYSIEDTKKIICEMMKMKRIGIPTLLCEMPTSNGNSFLFSDVGAIAQRLERLENKLLKDEISDMANNLYIQGLMAITYAIDVKKIKMPRVGIYSNGTEKNKGNFEIRKTNEIIENKLNTTDLGQMISYKGQQEMKNARDGEIDVLLTGGFIGNLVLKGIEAFGKTDETKKYSGAVLLGFNGILVKGHGNSDAQEIYHGILNTINASQNNINKEIKEMIAKYK